MTDSVRTLRDLIAEADMPAGAEALTVTGLTADSRRVRPGFVFAALPGVKADGRAFIEAAAAAGAVAIVAPRGTEAAVPVIETDDPRRVLALAAARFHPGQPAVMAAVTGTNGKSSTVEFLRQIWAATGKRAACLGTIGVHAPGGMRPLQHTTPDPVTLHVELARLAEEGVTHAAMEASSHGIVQRRLDGVRIEAAAFTNLTQDHLDYHASFGDYRAAKARLFDTLLEPGALAAINADSEHGAFMEAAAAERGARLFSWGWKGRDLRLEELSPRTRGLTLTFVYQGAERRVELPLIGEFQALNAMAAAALALGLGEDDEQVFGALANLEGVPGRLERAGVTPDGAAVYVDYAHTPDGVDTLLRAARPHCPGRLIVILGAGGDRDSAKRPLMGQAAAKRADLVIVTDDNPRSEDPAAIRAQVLAGCPGATEIGERAEAIRHAVRLLGPGDVLVIAGKGHETGQEIADRVIPFDDRQEAVKALLELSSGGTAFA